MDGILNINKEKDYTSHDVVACVKKILNTKKVGHAGTLDPMATGVLLVCVGKATKTSAYLMGGDKVYLAGFRLGITTDTDDITGKTLSVSDITVQKDEVENCLKAFRGTIEQIPPMYSAVKIDGKKLYQLARRGIAVERKAREITVHGIDLVDFNEQTGDGVMRISCSKGTYIRTICADLGKKLGCGGIMTTLCREKSGNFDYQNGVTLKQLQEITDEGKLHQYLLPVDTVFLPYPALYATITQAGRIRNGVGIPLDELEIPPLHQKFRVYDQDGSFLQIATIDPEKNMLKGEKNFF